ncbi:MAG: glycosyltransferase family 9 protein [bacterium]|nr:glycosyltransferase family 9 protein [bacterium]
MPLGIKKILAVRFSSIGDLVLTTPFYREVKALFPDAELHLITSREFAAIFAGNPHIDRLIPFDRKAGSAELDAQAAAIEAEGYDLAFDLHRSLRSRLLLRKGLGKSGVKVHHVDKRSFKRNLLLSPLKINLFKEASPQRLEYLKLLARYAGGRPLNGATALFPGPQERAEVETILAELKAEGKPLVALGPSASFALKCWPKESFLALGLALDQMGVQVVLLGGAADQEPRWISEQSGGRLVDLAGRLSFLGSAELLRWARLAVSNDSTVVHFAEAMGTPVVAIFGPTATEFGFAPFLPQSRVMERELSCRPCSRNGKGRCINKEQLACLKGISVEQVLAAVRPLLAARNG